LIIFQIAGKPSSAINDPGDRRSSFFSSAMTVVDGTSPPSHIAFSTNRAKGDPDSSSSRSKSPGEDCFIPVSVVNRLL
jgi:hypothetical protein